MNVRPKIRLGVVALLAAASTFLAVPANAVGAVTIAGTGGISPGLTQAGGAQTYTFSGTGGGVATDSSGNLQAGTYSCSLSGDDVIGTLTVGAGSLGGTCNTPCGSVGVSGSYIRTYAVVTANGRTNIGDCFSGNPFTVVCAFPPTSPPPVVSYAVTCVVTFNIP